MTCREKLMIEHPECINEKKPGGCCGCPHAYGYLDKPSYCYKSHILGPAVCTECWDREVEGE